MMEEISETTEESGTSGLQAILKAVETEDTSKAQSLALRAEAADMLVNVENEIARMRGGEVEPDWKKVCSSFGEQIRDTKGIIAAYDKLLETNGPGRINVIGEITDAHLLLLPFEVDQTPQIRSRSRKKLMKQAQGHLERSLENQKTATDAKALIKGYKNLLRVSSGHAVHP
ncbi:hypothetical protein FRC05_006524 [Tulasnella sp. 425]|nr:hypothetical protein FRC05_006524 [Tulasnella sp. 425]